MALLAHRDQHIEQVPISDIVRDRISLALGAKIPFTPIQPCDPQSSRLSILRLPGHFQ
jgi:hypothetical protein